MTWIASHIGLSVLGGSAIGAGILHFIAPKLIAKVSLALAKFMGSEIAKVEGLSTGDAGIDARLNLAVLCLMDVANRKMPAAAGEDKKKYVMSFFSKTSESVQAIVSSAIDQLWQTMKASIDAGVTAPQEAVIEDAVAKLKVLAAKP